MPDIKFDDVSYHESLMLSRCVELAREALEYGDEPFGSVLTDAEGAVLFEDRNRISGGDRTRHPEFEIARWAAANLTPEQRATAVVYTSGEHCAMCSAAHAWVGLGRIVFATSTAQLGEWRAALGAAPPPVAALPISAVAPGVPTTGPAAAFADEVRALHEAYAR
ncbi:nucleoside deaminase [Ruicaihuangia caeni]|uniref:nucleoside deaminase n=1 Tax=Ruicaihuangia caeni TaxID=3042517 RepID=UPI00338E39FB